MRDAVVVRRRRYKALGASLSRDVVTERVHGDRGIVVNPQHAPSANGPTESADKATSRRCAVFGRDIAKRTTGDAGDGMISDRRPKEPGRRAPKMAVGAEHKYLCGGLVYDCERIAVVIAGCDNPAREFNHCIGHGLVLRKLVDSGGRLHGAILGFGHAEGRERQR